MKKTNKRYNKIDAAILSELERIVGKENLSLAPETLIEYGHDETEDLSFPPELVVLPENSEQISEILKFANAANFPVTPRAGATGLSGGALPVLGGVSLSIEKLDKILEIDTENNFVITQTGVIVDTLKTEAAKHNLFYPPDPSSSGSSFVGGNLAMNAGGLHCVKYGTTADYVAGIEVVLPTGEIARLGGKLLKDVAGYNLVQLFVGSEGTLGIITEATLKLVPMPLFKTSLLAPFATVEQAAKAVSEIFKVGVTPAACEFLELAAIEAAEKLLEKPWYAKENSKAQLLIELDSFYQNTLENDAEKVAQACIDAGANDVLFLDTSEKHNEIWRMRKAVGEAVKGLAIYKEEDATVPRNKLPQLVEGVHKACDKFGVKVIIYGHAGDGNLHCNLLKLNISDEDWQTKLDPLVREIFALTKSLGGTITGEHGVGYVQKKYFKQFADPASYALQRKLKALFDPNYILNPEKIFAD